MTRKTVDDLVERARQGPRPAEAGPPARRPDGRRRGANCQRARSGTVPGSIIVRRNVLEWRCDPDCANRDPPDQQPGPTPSILMGRGCQCSSRRTACAGGARVGPCPPILFDQRLPSLAEQRLHGARGPLSRGERGRSPACAAVRRPAGHRGGAGRAGRAPRRAAGGRGGRGRTWSPARASGCGPSLRRVLNATGVVVHTNLGRAPLAPAARAAVARAAQGYANLELDLARRRARVAPRPRRGAAARADRRRGGRRGQQLRRGGAAGRGGAGGPRARGGRLARAADRDRRRLPDARGDRAGRRAAGRGRHDQPHAPGRLRGGAGAGDGRRSCARTRRTSARSASWRRSAVEALCALGVAGDRRRRLGRARRRARACWRASRPCAAPCGPARRWWRSRATSCWAGRRPGSWSGTRPRSRPAGATRSRARCGSTSCRWRRSRRRWRSTAIRRSRARELPVLAMLTLGRRRSCARGRERLAAATGGEVVEAAGARRRRRAAAARAARARWSRSIPGPAGADALAARAARRRPGGRRPHRARPRAARPAHARARRARRRRRGGASRRADDGAAAHARHRGAHRPRQDGARRRAHRRRHGPAAGGEARAGSRSRSATRGSICPAAGGCPSSTCRGTSASCARWSPARPASTSS